MLLVTILIVLTVIIFIGTVIFGAPYVPTHKISVSQAIDLLGKPKNGHHLLELGAGDGRLAVAAATAGWKVTAYEINPILFAVVWSKLRRYNQAKVLLANYHKITWPNDANAIYIFGSKKELEWLRQKIDRMSVESVRVVTYGFELPETKLTKTKGGFNCYDTKPKVANR